MILAQLGLGMGKQKSENSFHKTLGLNNFYSLLHQSVVYPPWTILSESLIWWSLLRLRIGPFEFIYELWVSLINQIEVWANDHHQFIENVALGVGLLTDLVIIVAMCHFPKRLPAGFCNESTCTLYSTGTLTGYLALYMFLLFWTNYCARAVVLCTLILVSRTSLQINTQSWCSVQSV